MHILHDVLVIELIFWIPKSASNGVLNCQVIDFHL